MKNIIYKEAMETIKTGVPTSNMSKQTQQSTNKKDSFNDYKVIKSIGQGAFGEVYLAKDRLNSQIYAIKSIAKSFLIKQKKDHHVFQEKLILQSCNFPFLVKLFKTFQDDSKIYFVLEYIQNGELSSYIRKKS